MNITFKLFATLGGHLPPGARANAVDIDVDGQDSAIDILQRYQVPLEEVHLVLVNGHYFDEAMRTTPGLLKEGDTLAIWPPVAGG